MVPLEFLDSLVRLKFVPRSGWISYRISKNDVESVSSHSHAVATIAMTIAETMQSKRQRVDVEKVLKMALLHDLSEALTFDISKAYLRYLGRAGARLKNRLEGKAASRILADLRNDRIRRVFAESIEEYSRSRSLEARIVHSADALDLLLQIIEYERMGYSKRTLDPIWRQTRENLLAQKMRIASEWLKELERLRRRLPVRHRLANVS
jgi:putative hydrolase of HD superfamily